MPKVIHHLFTDDELSRRKTQDLITSNYAKLIAEKNIEDISLENVLEESGISRSTFYKCFPGVNSLSELTAKKLANELFSELNSSVQKADDIAIIVASKTRLGIRLAVSVPKLARVALKIKWPDRNAGLRFLPDMKKDIEQGIKQGRFSDMPAAIGVNIIFSTLKSVIQEITTGDFSPDAEILYVNQAIYQMLLGLGVDEKSALEISQIPSSELPPYPKKGITGNLLKLIANNR